MNPNHSVSFFDRQFQLQLENLDFRLNPLELEVLLIEGTSYLDMFQPGHYCLFARGELERRFAGRDTMHSGFRDFDAPGGFIKSFATLIARKPSGKPAMQEPPAGQARVAEDP